MGVGGVGLCQAMRVMAAKPEAVQIYEYSGSQVCLVKG